jgi:multiple sugar transport system ATP-binding protein
LTGGRPSCRAGSASASAIGRAIVRTPKLFLFDEPLSNLDAALRVNTRIEIARLHRSWATMIYVTHDQVEAMTLADKIVMLNNGRIEQVGAPMELYNDPDNEFVASFLGSPAMNFLPAEPLGGPAGHVVGVRPEHLRISEAGRLKGKVTHVEMLGGDTNIMIDTEAGERVTVREFGQFDIAPDAVVALDFEDRHAFRFDAKGHRIRATAMA